MCYITNLYICTFSLVIYLIHIDKLILSTIYLSRYFFNMLYWLHIHLVSLLKLRLDLDDMLILCMAICCMITLLILDHMLFVCVGHTCIPLAFNH